MEAAEPTLFPENDHSLGAQIAEVKRELDQRRHVYIRLINTGVLKQHVANHRLAVMEAVLRSLKKLKEEQDRAGKQGRT